MILVYIPALTSRVEYTFNLIFAELLGVEYKLTDNEGEFIAYTGAKLNYSLKDTGEGLFLHAAGILSETMIRPQNIEPKEFEGSPVIFYQPDKTSVLPFDPLAAAFYLVTRYEEYLPFRADRYGRFRVKDSIASNAGFLHTPVVNHWALRLMRIIQERYPDIRFNLPAYRFLPTIDIDHAYAYKCRSFFRTTGAYARSLGRFDWSDLVLRTAVLLGRKQDPYDNYAYLDVVHKKNGLTALYFILVADYGGNDNNVNIRETKFRTLLMQIDNNSIIGIHPSLSSNKHFSKLNTELTRLEKTVHHSITLSRQHFLKFSFPKTYRDLEDLGITDDFSMGFTLTSGFRAGIASPFYFYDLVKNDVTSLRIHPVSIMDITLRDHYHDNQSKALERIRKIIAEVKQVNGEFISIWHNESLSDRERWYGWRRVYEEMLESAK
ncbi:MAG: polysaccharide deacetylase family protein [Bacteroidetes bacterium]|nr:polysaccharide deacetylase family protein [Bacteroidota bacterium]